jgi:alkylation response protein AidB-like acyl-CoA dehydrogenase
VAVDVREAGLRSGGMPDAAGLNFFDEDENLRFALALRMAPADFERALPILREAGAVAGGELDRLARVAERNPPRLVQYDARGDRVDDIEYHPAYAEMERIAFGRFGLAAMSHRPGVLGWPGPAPHLLKYAISYLLIQSEFGLFCPVNMTDSLARVLHKFGGPALCERFLPGLTSTDMDTLLQGAMFMTEKAGGSDVGATETVARHEDGGWRLSGDKWFCSNVSAGLILTLARPAGAPAGTRGLGLFLVPKRLEDGRRNRYRINRLKDKLGTRDMASGEVTLDGAFAYQVGALEHGFVHMMEMVNSSRLSNAMRAAALTRRGLLEAQVHAAGRVAFGRPLDELPLMRETLLELTLDSESALAAVLHTGGVFDAADGGDAAAGRLLRILTPLIKLAICKRARWSTGEAMEARGGNGYIEDWVNPRLLRDAHLGSIWEGSSNVIALDVLRAIARDGAHEALFSDIAARLDAVRDPAVARAAALLRPRLAGLRGRVELTAGLPRDEAELPMLELSDRLYQLYAASLLVEEAEAQARAGSYRKLVLAAEFIRRRLTADPDGWPGPRPGSGACFPALMRWQPVPGETARSLLDVLEQRSP